MLALDWFIVVVYFLILLVISFWLSTRQTDTEDYFLGGKRLGSGLVATSLAANQVSAISLIGAPAFVAIKTNGGLRWLQYEFAVPLAMIIIMFVLVPTYRKLTGATIFELLENRFSKRVRLVLSAVFTVSRGLATGIVLFTSAIVLSAATGIDELTTTIIIGLVAITYTSMGGLAADIISDAFQLGILFIGTLIALFVGIELTGGFHTAFSALSPDRSMTIDFSALGIAGGDSFGFLPMVIGGLFLYISYYGCDQSQAQRLLSTPNEKSAQNALMINGLIRFPIVLVYCLLGVALAAFIAGDGALWLLQSDVNTNVNHLVPAFILDFLPTGIVGLFMAGIFSATMSSIDSNINSLAAVTIHDFLPERISQNKPLLLSRLATIFWGIFAIASGFLLSRSGETVIELVNKIGSAFYGPVLAVFIAAAISKRANERSVLVGLTGGLIINLSLWLFFPNISWLWWNPIGFVAATILIQIIPGKVANKPPTGSVSLKAIVSDRRTLVLGTIFIVILLVTYWLDRLF